MTIKKIKHMEKNQDQAHKKQIIADYMRKLGKKGGAKTAEKGSAYFSKMASARWAKHNK